MLTSLQLIPSGLPLACDPANVRVMPLPAAILNLPSRGDELRDVLIRWANQNSGSDHLAGLAAMHALLVDAFRVIGPVESVPLPGTSAQALRVCFRPEARWQILFSGHYDTVYGADHPFQTCTLLDRDTLRGPGVADMKGGLVVMLAALTAFAQLPDAGQVGGEVLLSPDEEIGSASSRALLEEAAGRHHFGLVFEPCRENGDLVRARMGTGIFTVTCRGRSAHAGRAPGEGRNAIVALAEFLPKADALNRELPSILLNIGRISGGGAVNIVPDLAQAEINLRVSRPEDIARVLQRLNEAAAPINAREGYALTIEGKFNRLPKEITPQDEQLFNAWRACGRELGVALNWQDVGGGSDGNLLSAASLPNLDGLGPLGGQLHSPNEYLKLDTLVPRTQVAALFLHHLATGQIEAPARVLASSPAAAQGVH